MSLIFFDLLKIWAKKRVPSFLCREIRLWDKAWFFYEGERGLCQGAFDRNRNKEKKVYGHLGHIRQTRGKHFIIIPAQCRKCLLIFEIRKRLKKTGWCPLCHCEIMQSQLFKISWIFDIIFGIAPVADMIWERSSCKSSLLQQAILQSLKDKVLSINPDFRLFSQFADMRRKQFFRESRLEISD